MKRINPSVKSPEGKQTRIGKRVGNMVVIMQVISVVFAVGMCVIMFRSLSMGMLKQRCTNGTNMLSYVLSQTDGTEDVNQLLDELKSRMGCEFTIFEGNTRAYTTVIQNGQRVVGTALSPELSEIVLQKGQSYVGTATILNEQYLCSYVPVRDTSGAISGLLFAGISSAEANRQIVMTVVCSTLVSIAVIIVCIFFLTAYLKKTVSFPLAEITQVASRLEQGNLGLNGGGESGIAIHSNDEVGRLARIFERTIQRLRSYIGEIASVLDAIASGDLTASTQQEYVGDFISIKASLDGIQAKLNDTLSQIRESAEQVSSGAEQVSNGAQALAQGATEQASSVEELSATVSEISGNAQRTAQATREAGQFVDQAGAQLNISVGYVQQLNTAMAHISSSSEEISKIIAAVEAARAGSAGKGFAVVADEVRNLASKSDEAAKATKGLIENSVQATGRGSRIVSEVSSTLNKTLELVVQSNEAISAIVSAVEKDAESISQVTEGIGQISAVVQSNSASSEESAAVSSELFSQVQVMEAQTKRFKLRK